MKLKEWVAYWQETYDKPAVRPSTYQAHGYLLKNHIVPMSAPMIKCKKTPRKKCSLVAKEAKKR